MLRLPQEFHAFQVVQQGSHFQNILASAEHFGQFVFAAVLLQNFLELGLGETAELRMLEQPLFENVQSRGAFVQLSKHSLKQSRPLLLENFNKIRVTRKTLQELAYVDGERALSEEAAEDLWKFLVVSLNERLQLSCKLSLLKL